MFLFIYYYLLYIIIPSFFNDSTSQLTVNSDIATSIYLEYERVVNAFLTPVQVIFMQDLIER